MKSKFISLLFLPIIPLSIIFGNISYRYIEGDDDIHSGSTYPYYIYSDRVGPIYKGIQNEVFECYVDITKKEHAYGYGYIELDVFDKPNAYEYEYVEYVRSETIPLIQGRNVFSIDFNLNNYNFIKQTYFTIYFGKTNSDVLAKQNFTIIPLDKDKVYNTKNDEIISISNACFQLNASNSFSESYNFSVTNDYFSNDKYMRLDLTNLYLYYYSSFPFECDDIQLVIFDTNNLYKNIETVTKDGFPYISLDFIQENSTIKFIQKDNLYLDKDILTLYSTSNENTQLTNYIYIPRGGEDYIDQYQFEIRFINAGINKLNINHRLTFYLGRTIMGDCITSEYCIEGGIRD